MSRLRVVPIVEGHGEVAAIRILLQRIRDEMIHGDYLEVHRPIRYPRGKLVKSEGIRKAVGLAALRLETEESSDAGFVLVLIDANGDCPAEVAPGLLGRLQGVGPDLDVACVVAKVEYETWFAAAAESLTDLLDLGRPPDVRERPEETGTGKGWIQSRFRGVRYSETVDQPRMRARMDLGLCRQRSPSFDKLCRVLEARMGR